MKNIKFSLFFLFLIIISASNCEDNTSIHQDERILEKAKKWIKEDDVLNRGFNAENGFNFWVGFGCSKENSPSEIGYKWLDFENKQLNTEEITTTTEISFFNDFEFLSDETLTNCTKNRNEIKRLSKNYDYLVQRYRQLNSFREYNDTSISSFETKTPNFRTILIINKLILSEIALKFEDNRNQALKQLHQEIKFSMGMLNNSNTIVGELVVLMSLSNEINLYNAFLNHAEQQLDSNYFTINRITNKETSWDEISKKLFLMNIRSKTSLFSKNLFPNSSISEVLNQKEIYENESIRINRLINRSYKIYNHLSKCSTVEINNFKNLAENFPKFERTIYDETNDALGEIIYPELYLEYIKCYHIVNAMISITNLKHNIMAQQLTSEQIANQVSEWNKLNENRIQINWDSNIRILFFDVTSDYKNVFNMIKNAKNELRIL